LENELLHIGGGLEAASNVCASGMLGRLLAFWRSSCGSASFFGIFMHKKNSAFFFCKRPKKKIPYGIITPKVLTITKGGMVRKYLFKVSLRGDLA